MRKRLTAGVSLALFLSLTVAGYAQYAAEPSVGDQILCVTIYLIDGGVLEGHILDSDENAITIEPSLGGRTIIPRQNIREIKQSRLADPNVESRKQQYEKPPLSNGTIGKEILAGGGLGTILSIPGGMIGFRIADALWPPEGEHGAWMTNAEFACGAVGFIAGWVLGSATGVYLVGTKGNVTGSFSRALLGSIVGAGCLPVPLFGPAIGAAFAFNRTRRYESPFGEPGNALINFRHGQMRLAVPIVYFRPDCPGRGGLSQNVNLLKVRF